MASDTEIRYPGDDETKEWQIARLDFEFKMSNIEQYKCWEWSVEEQSPNNKDGRLISWTPKYHLWYEIITLKVRYQLKYISVTHSTKQKQKGRKKKHEKPISGRFSRQLEPTIKKRQNPNILIKLQSYNWNHRFTRCVVGINEELKTWAISSINPYIFVRWSIPSTRILSVKNCNKPQNFASSSLVPTLCESQNRFLIPPLPKSISLAGKNLLKIECGKLQLR